MTRGAQRDKDRARADARAGKNASGSSGGGGLKQAAKGASDAAALAAKKEMKAKLKAEGKIKEKTGGTKAPPKSKVKNAVRLGQAEGKRIRLGLCPCVCVCVMCGEGEVCGVVRVHEYAVVRYRLLAPHRLTCGVSALPPARSLASHRHQLSFPIELTVVGAPSLPPLFRVTGLSCSRLTRTRERGTPSSRQSRRRRASLCSKHSCSKHTEMRKSTERREGRKKGSLPFKTSR